MEENLMEKLLNDFNGTLEEFNELVRKNDFDGVTRVLNEVNKLIQERNGIALDDREPQYDHVLHEILDKMNGIVEKVTMVQGSDGIYGKRYYTNKQVEEMIAQAEAELEEITRMVQTYEEVNDEAYAQARRDRSAIIARIAELRACLVEGQEYSTLTYVDSHLAELQEERARLLEEKEANLREIERLRAEERTETAGNPADQARVDEINTRLAELENLFSNLEGQINNIRETSIRELIDNLRAETERITELEARRAELQNRLREAGDRVRDTEGYDEQNAQARADYSELVSEISDIDAELSRTTEHTNDIEFLESLLPETQERVNVLDPMDYTYMGRLSDEEIIRRLLSEDLHLSEEEINATIGEYELVQAEAGAHDENGEDNPISMRQLVRTRNVKADITIGEAINSLEAQLNDGPLVDHTQEIIEIDNRIAELEGEINEAQSRIEEIQAQQIADTISQIQQAETELESRRAELQNRLREAGERVRDTEGYDEQNAQAHADYSELVSEISDIDAELSRIRENAEDIEFLESLLPEVEETENVLDPMDYTYMGRLSDEEIIRRLLSEQLRLSEEEINATIGEYELVQAEAGAHDENGEDNPISMRQLVRTRKVKQTITVGEGLKNLDEEIAKLEEQRAELQRRLREAGERVRDTRGFDEQYAQARADYSALVEEISNIDSQIAQIREKQTKLKEIVEIAKEEEKITSAKLQQENLIARRNELAQDTTRQENPDIREKINRLKQISGITALELQLQQYKDEYEKLQKEKETLVPTPGQPGIDNSEKIAALEARNREIDARIAEIDKEIESISGIVPPRKETEKLDIGKTAHEIGDKIFKTAAIRRELASRNISRDEFLTFYQAGLDKTNEQIDQLSEQYQKYLEEIKKVLSNPEDPTKRIDILIDEAEREGNTELSTKLYEQLRKNFIEAGREEQLKVAGLDKEITSQEDIEKMKIFFEAYRESVVEGSSKIKTSIGELKENAMIFSTEISRINLEKATLEMAGNSVEELKNKTEERIKTRKMLLEATITPEKDLTDEQKELLESWQNASERFLSKKVTQKFIYTDKDGKQRIIDVDSIDDTYPEYAKDIEFLGVPAYKENLEQVSAWNQTKDPYIFGEIVGKAFDKAEAQKEGSGQEIIDRIIADKQKYVETFNGIPNPHKVKYENWKTAGSTLKEMKPVSKDLPMATRAKNIAENVFRFLGIRTPKFTRIDEHGNKVRDIKSGLGTLAVDGLVIGAVTASAIAWGPAVAAVGYVAKGAVTVGNRIAGRVEYAKHKDEIDSNKPVIHHADRNAREVARKAYYREQGDNKLVAWVKAKSDKYFTRKREKETERAIVDKLVDEYSKSEDKRAESLKENIEISEANQRARLRNQEKIAMGANTYNDMVRDPDAVDMNEATATIARNAVLEANRPGTGKEDVNKGSTEVRKEQYIKEEENVEKTSDLNEKAVETVAAPVSALTEEQIYTGRKQYVDRLNKVLTMITAVGLKFGYTAWKNGLTKEDVIHHPAETEEQVIHHDPVYEEEIIHHDAIYGGGRKTYETQFDTDITLEDLQNSYKGKIFDGYESVSGGLGEKVTAAAQDKGITAAWYDNGTEWGTGISNHAPKITDEFNPQALLAADGKHISPDVTVKQLLDAVGCPEDKLDKFFISVEDHSWIRGTDIMKDLTKEVLVEKPPVLITPAWDETVKTLVTPAWDEIVENVVTPAWDETIKTISAEKAIKAIVDGAIIGTGVGVADALHEAVQTTYINGATPGRPEEVTPEATDTFDKIANKLFVAAEPEIELKAEKHSTDRLEQDEYEEPVPVEYEEPIELDEEMYEEYEEPVEYYDADYEEKTDNPEKTDDDEELEI